MIFKKKQPLNLLLLVPVRKELEFTDIEGKVTLLIPKFKNQWFSSWFIPRHKTSHIHFRLDEIGSQVWRLIDGNKTVNDICNEMNPFLTNLGKSTDHIEDRVAGFIKDLAKHEFIILNEAQSQSGE